MFMATTILVFFVLAVCVFVAGRPVVLAPMFRSARMSVGGTCCVGLGSTLMALVIGFLPAANAGGRVLADDKSAQDSKADADPVIHLEAETPEIPSGRPEWIGNEPSLSSKVHTIAVASGPYATNNESLKALDQALVKTMREYVAEQLHSDMAARMITFDARTIKRQWVKEDTYHDEAKYSVGKMHENFALVKLDAKFRADLTKRWNKVRAGSRLLQTGVVTGAVLLLVASVFGYFRADNATRGYYTSRLQFMTAAAILAVVGAGTFIFRFIPSL